MPPKDRWAPGRLPSGQPHLIVREEQPEDAEFAMAHLNSWVTPNPLFFRRNHFRYPKVDQPSWRLDLTGAAARPLRLSLDDLRRMPQTSQWTTLECSGNKRAYYEPETEGTQWTAGAIGNAEWGGVPLATLLALARPLTGAVEVLFVGADEGIFKETGERVHFARSLPLDQALRPDLLLALTMNGEPLPQRHGAPLRLVVPTWYAMASVKWLTRIELLTRPFRGPFQVRDYVYIPSPGAYDRSVPVTWQRVNSTITQPVDGARVQPGPLTVRGVAWAGNAPPERVEVSLNGGRSWTCAELIDPALPAVWRLWHWVSPPLSPGVYQILVRATDAAGETQPRRAAWNAKGYGNNSMIPLTIIVE